MAAPAARNPKPDPKPLTGRAVLLMLVMFFAVVIGVNMVMMKLAADTLSGTEVDSAYRASLAYKLEIEAARQQAARGWRVDAHVERSADGIARVRIDARDRNGVPVGATFFARLSRPTDRRADRVVVLTAQGAGSYRGEAADVLPGQWDLVIEAEGEAGRMYLSTNRILLN